jgi:hypothetical protein
MLLRYRSSAAAMTQRLSWFPSLSPRNTSMTTAFPLRGGGKEMGMMSDPNRPPYRPPEDNDWGYLPFVVAIVGGFFLAWLVMRPTTDDHTRVADNAPRSEIPSPAPKSAPAPRPDPQKVF